MLIVNAGQPLTRGRGTVLTGIRRLKIRHNREAKNVIQNTIETPVPPPPASFFEYPGQAGPGLPAGICFQCSVLSSTFKDGGKLFKLVFNRDSITFESAMVTKLPDMPTPMVPPRVLEN